MLIIFWYFLMVEQVFLSPQTKWSMIISNKHGIYAFPHELPKDIRLRILRNLEIPGKSQKFKELLPSSQSSSQNGNFVSISKNLIKNRNWAFPAVRYLT